MSLADTWPCRTIVEGAAHGAAVISPLPFSFAGELDVETGKVSNSRSALFGTCLTGTVFVYPYGRGSSSSSSVIAEAIRRGTAPAAIVSVRVEHLLVVGVLVAGAMFERSLPMVAVAESVLAELRPGDQLLVDTTTNTVRRQRPDQRTAIRSVRSRWTHPSLRVRRALPSWLNHPLGRAVCAGT